MRTFRVDLKKAVEFHGHLCSGQCIGIKMAHMGMEALGLDTLSVQGATRFSRPALVQFKPPERWTSSANSRVGNAEMGQSRPFQTYSPLYTKGNETDGKKILVFVECNRCPADSILISTGCRIGRRTYVFKDFGKVAATFVNLENQEAIRIRQVKHCYPEPGEDMLAYFENLPYNAFLAAQRVRVPLGAGDMPGPPVAVAVCARCGEEVMNLRHVEKDGQCLCKSCTGMGYYQVL